MVKHIDPKLYIAALEDLVTRLGSAKDRKIVDESDRNLIAFATSNVAVRKAKEEADRLAKAAEEARGAWMANRGDSVVDKDPHPSDVLPSLSVFLADAELSRRTENVVTNNLSPHHSLLNLVMMTEKEVRDWRHAGYRTISEIRDVLLMRNLRLGMTKEEAEAAYKKL